MTTPDVAFSSEGGRSKGLLFGIILMVVVESVGLHALLYRRWPYASLLLLAANVGMIWWLIREFRSENVTFLRDDDIFVRFGTAISARVPLASVRDVRVPSWREVPEQGTAGFVRLAGGDDPNVLLRLEPPVAVRLAFGLRKTVGLLGLRLDEPQRFVATVQARMSA